MFALAPRRSAGSTLRSTEHLFLAAAKPFWTVEDIWRVVAGFDAFFEDNYERMVRLLTLALGDRSTAEDLAQEAFVVALSKWSRVSSMDRPAGWVYVVAVRKGRKRLHQEGTRQRILVRREGLTRSEGQSGDTSGSIAARIDIERVLGCLPPRQRMALVLRYLADLSIHEVADAMGCGEGTVKATLHAARSSLRIELDQEESL